MEIASSKADFAKVLNEGRALYAHCMANKGALHHKPGIEAAFLRIFIAWESFIQEAIICYLAGQQTPDGSDSRVSFHVASVDAAYRLLHIERPYLLWTDMNTVGERMSALFEFDAPLAEAFRGTRQHLNAMSIVRNVIAHESEAAWKRFETNLLPNLPRKAVGSYDRPYEILVAKKRAKPLTWFEEMANQLDTFHAVAAP